MSLFLGKIHYWVFEKIQNYENIEDAIIKWAESKELPVSEWIKDIHSKFGKPSEKKPLDEIVDDSNIHGWLQGKIESAEMRQGALVTRILKANEGYKTDLLSIYENQGKNSASHYKETAETLEGMYKALNDFLLEGMPCDRVTEVLSSNENEFLWQITHCLHTPHWDRVGGNIQNFYDLREAWIKGFISILNPSFEYTRLPDNVHRVIKK